MQRSVHTSRVPLPSSTRCWDSREPLTCILLVSNLGGTEGGDGERGGRREGGTERGGDGERGDGERGMVNTQRPFSQLLS